MKRGISLLLCAVMLACMMNSAPYAAAEPEPELVDSGIDYHDSTETISTNPERGQVVDGGWSMCSNYGGTPVKNPTGALNTLMYDLRCFSAGNDYKNNGKGKTGVGGEDIPINDQTLDALRQTLENARKNGSTVIFRFAYAWDDQYGNEPADFNMLLHHIEQLSGVINDYADVVLSIEAGMAGPWGEMHSSKYVENGYGAKILGKWLDCLDESVTVQSRSPKYILEYYNMTPKGFTDRLPVSYKENFYRLGMYNDGYLGTDNDYGTFYDNSGSHLSREQGKKFLKYLDHVPYGGELAYVTEDYAKKHSILYKNDYNIVEEFYSTHLSYLRNIGRLTHQLTKCMTEITFDESYAFEGMPDVSEYYGLDLQKFAIDHMGYRFVLRESLLSESAAPGGEVRLVGKIENTGFGSVCKDTEAELILYKKGAYYSCPIELNVKNDIKSCVTYSYDYTLMLPRNIAAGDYDVFLRISRENDNLADDILATIAFANDGVYQRGLGANRLGSVSVKGSAVSENSGFCLKGSGEDAETVPTVISGYTATATADIGQKVTLGYFIEGVTGLTYRVNGVALETVNGRAEFVMSARTIGECTAIYQTKNGKTETKTFMTLTVAGHDYQETSRTDSTCTSSGKVIYTCTDCKDVIESPLPMLGHEYEAALGEDVCRNVCVNCGNSAPISGEYDTAMPGVTAENAEPQSASAGKIMIVGKDLQEYTVQEETDTIYFAMNISGLSGPAVVGGLRTVTYAADSTQSINSNASGNMTYFTGYQINDGDGTYIFSIDFSLVNWTSPLKFGTVSMININDPTVSKGPASSGLDGAQFTAVGVYEAKPYYDVYFCDEEGNVISHAKGEYVIETGKLKTSAVKLLPITELCPDADMAKEDDSGVEYQFIGWKNVNGSTADYALGTMIMVPAYKVICHHENIVISDIPALCTTDGSYKKYCENCNEVFEDRVIGALGHDFSSEYTVDIQPTDIKPGLKSLHCTRCDETKDAMPIPPLKTPAERFTDVKEGAWYYEAVDYAITNSIFNGMDAKTFAPNVYVTRAMLVQVLYNLDGAPDVSNEPCLFKDVPEKEWYASAVRWASNRGIVYGVSDTEFSPQTNITREQLAALIYRYAEYKGYSTNARSNLDKFPDGVRTSSYAVESLAWAVGTGLVTGNEINHVVMLDPKGNATRAQAALILMRFCESFAE